MSHWLLDASGSAPRCLNFAETSFCPDSCQTSLQVAGQQGKYLAYLFARNNIRPAANLQHVEPFRYSHSGSTAYVGSDRAVFDLPGFGPLTGEADQLMHIIMAGINEYSVH